MQNKVNDTLNLAEKYKFLTYKEVSALEGTKISEVMDTVLS